MVSKLACALLNAVSVSVAIVALTLGAATALAASDPVVKLETRTEKEALAKGRIAVHVEVRRSSRVRVLAKFSAGVSRNFRLDPRTERVGRDGRLFHLPLSERQRRIIAAAIDVCADAPVSIRARALDLAGDPTTRLDDKLRRPASC